MVDFSGVFASRILSFTKRIDVSRPYSNGEEDVSTISVVRPSTTRCTCCRGFCPPALKKKGSMRQHLGWKTPGVPKAAQDAQTHGDAHLKHSKQRRHGIGVGRHSSRRRVRPRFDYRPAQSDAIARLRRRLPFMQIFFKEKVYGYGFIIGKL